MNRRTFLFTSSGAAAGSLLVRGVASAEPDSTLLIPESALVTGIPKPLRYGEVPGFLSAAQISPHHTAHYGGALKAFVGVEQAMEESFAKGTPIEPAALERMKQIQSSRGNSVVLHELYFEGLIPAAVDPRENVRRAIEKRFGSVERWAADFIASANTAAGWAMLVVHPINGKLYNVVSDEHAQGPLWLAAPLVVIDTYEHAFYIDYQNRKSEYVEKFMSFIDWDEAERRYRHVVGR